MLNKIVFLCTNPRERFLPLTFQSYSWEYYQLVKRLVSLKNRKMECREYIDTYGTVGEWGEDDLVFAMNQNLQIWYVQSDRKIFYEKIFMEADQVIMGLPGGRREFDKMYMSVFPWKDQILFLWGEHTRKDAWYVEKIRKECMLKQEQFIKLEPGWWKAFGIEKLPLVNGSFQMFHIYSENSPSESSSRFVSGR